MQTEFVVQTKNLCKAFAGKEIIHNCTMSVERGTVYGFLGKNGAGKTTVFKILLGLLKPTMGGSKRFRHGQQQKQFGGIEADRKSDRNTDIL